jgi:ABC-2 type transport system ATP-binding protein
MTFEGLVVMTDYAIHTQDLTKDFAKFRAVNGVTFNVRRASIFGFLGPNGAGKTTTMRVLLGLLAPTSGKAEVLGYDVAHRPRAVKKRIGYMSQRFSLYDDLTVGENLRFYGRTYGLDDKKLRERIGFVLEMADLVGRDRLRARDLSGGWRQRLALGTAILHEPELVFLDEPTAGVDPVSRRTFWELLYRLAAGGTTIFVTTHYMDEAEHCQELAFIHAGKIVAQGSPDAIKMTLMQGQVLELSPDQPAEAMRLLKAARAEGRLQVDDIALYGAQVHVVAQDASQLIGPIAQLLRGGGLEPGPMDVIAPSLEDVFLSCIR